MPGIVLGSGHVNIKNVNFQGDPVLIKETHRAKPYSRPCIPDGGKNWFSGIREKNLKKIDTCVCITESLCCTPETNTTL